MRQTTTGSCACNAVQYQVREELKSVVNCHCNKCKKMSGAAFSAIALIQEQNFEITAGQNHIAAYAISENATKHFCSQCGSPVYNVHKKYPGYYLLPIGTLDDPNIASPVMNIYCETMLPWVKKISEFKNFAKLPEK